MNNKGDGAGEVGGEIKNFSCCRSFEQFKAKQPVETENEDTSRSGAEKSVVGANADTNGSYFPDVQGRWLFFLHTHRGERNNKGNGQKSNKNFAQKIGVKMQGQERPQSCADERKNNALSREIIANESLCGIADDGRRCAKGCAKFIAGEDMMRRQAEHKQGTG